MMTARTRIGTAVGAASAVTPTPERTPATQTRRRPTRVGTTKALAGQVTGSTAPPPAAPAHAQHVALSRHLPALDGLRALAVLAVITQHAWHRVLPGGWIGVDLFFVLSGFLITSLLVDERVSSGAIRLGRFYARRALRLLPALMVAMPLGIVLADVADPRRVSETVAEALTSALYVSNWWVGDLLVPSGFLGHTWSLAVEEQYYLVWPLLLGAMIAVAGTRGTSRMILVLIACVVVHRALDWRGWGLYVRTDTRGDSLLVGAALALAVARGWRPSARSRRLAGAACASALLAVALFFNTEVTGWTPMVLGGFTLVALASAGVVAQAVWDAGPFLTSRALVFTGRRSYGLYLYHYPIVRTLEVRLGEGPACLAASLALSFMVACLSYRYLELPFLRLKARVASARTAHPTYATAPSVAR